MDLILPTAVGAALALAVSVFARLSGFDRDRAFYPTVLIVVASYYDLFAVMGGSTRALIMETLMFVGFSVAAVLGFKNNLWIAVAGLVGHGIQDLFHGHVITNPGVPAWWPWWCAAYDVVAGAFLAWLLVRAKIPPHASVRP